MEKLNSNKNNNKSHAIFVPIPLQGHVNPFVQLAIKLASKGFSITFINTEYIHHQITLSNPTSPGDIFAKARVDLGLDIEYVTVTDGLPLEYDRSLNYERWVGSFMYCFPAHIEVAIAKILGSRPSVCCLVADTFYHWASQMAKKFGLLHVSFWTQPALVLDIWFHVHLLKENGHIGPGSGTRNDLIDYIPGIKAMKRTDLMSYLQEEDLTTIEHQLIFGSMNDCKRADFILANTAQELEHNATTAIQAHIPFYTIGPLRSIGPAKAQVSTSLWPESDCTQWLDTKPDGSVLFVSFGSFAHVSKEDLTEIAYGLKLSGVNFIWAIRPDMVSSEEQDPVPFGFRDEVQGRGVVLTWTSQNAVLSHPAVGGFLTHCGWNSVLESIWYEIPLLCFPLKTDQFSNRMLVVDDWQIGRNLCEMKCVTKEEVSQNVQNLISGSLRCQLKDNIKGVKSILENALKREGSSSKSIDHFVEDLKVAWTATLSS